MTNKFLYRYQLETIEHLDETKSNIEKLTKDEYLIPIGTYETDRDEGILCLNINGIYDCPFILNSYYLDLEYCKKENDTTIWMVKNNDIKIKFYDDLFLKLNQAIDTILNDNAAREAFHNKLNNQLQAINNSL